jgi:hypothetical protein
MPTDPEKIIKLMENVHTLDTRTQEIIENIRQKIDKADGSTVTVETSEMATIGLFLMLNNEYMKTALEQYMNLKDFVETMTVKMNDLAK